MALLSLPVSGAAGPRHSPQLLGDRGDRGGGGGDGGADTTGAAGGSGIWIISAPIGTMRATGGSHTTSGGNDIWTFTSGGTWVPTFFSPITANFGSFVLTGESSVLTSARHLVASFGSFSLTGFVASLVRSLTAWTQLIKHSDSWTNESKDTDSWAQGTKHTTPWQDEGKQP